MTDEQIKEIMALVDELSASVARETIPECRGGYAKARAAIESALRAAVPAIPARRELDATALHDLIAEHLRGTFHCTRVWSAWSYGTMSEDDFGPVDESDTPQEITDAVIAMIEASPQAPQAAQPGKPSECEWTNCPRRVGDTCCNDCPGWSAQPTGAVPNTEVVRPEGCERTQS